MARIARLYRSCSKRDKDASFRLKSRNITISGTRLIEEFLCHEYSSAVDRQCLFSMTTSRKIAEECHTVWEDRTEIRYADIDIDDLPSEILTLFPLYDRKALMLYMASQPELIERGYVVNPITGSKYTIVGMLNYCRKGLCSMAHSLLEVMVQCNGLKLHPLEELKNADEITEEASQQILTEYYNENSQATHAERIKLQEYLIDFFNSAPNLKEKRLLNLIPEILESNKLEM